MVDEHVTYDMVHNSSAGILGWAFADVKPWDYFEPPKSPSANGGCVAFNNEPNTSKECAPRSKSTSAEKIKAARLMVGEENVRVLEAMGALDTVLDQVAIMTTDDGDPAAFGVDWVDTEIEVCLDSGCCDHVMDLQDAPGYQAYLVESPGSKRKQQFVVGNGERVPNEGQLVLNLESDVDKCTRKLQSTFQVAEVTRPLMSVSKICDQGLRCLFDDQEALVCDKVSGKVLVTFKRHGGLYITRMRLKPPEGLPGRHDRLQV